MIRRSARVVAVEGERSLVEIAPEAGCARCAAGRGCGQGLFGRERAPVRLYLPREAHHAPGRTVEVGLDPEPVERAAIRVYGLPLAGLLLGAAAGQAAAGDLGAALLAAAGTLLGLALARRRTATLALPCAADPGAQ